MQVVECVCLLTVYTMHVCPDHQLKWENCNSARVAAPAKNREETKKNHRNIENCFFLLLQNVFILYLSIYFRAR